MDAELKPLTPHQHAQVATYEGELRKWNKKINLVSNSTLENFHTRHVQDSRQLLEYVPIGVQKWVDMGSGGGFPGMIIALFAQERLPDLAVTLVESDARKVAFLRHVAAALSLRVEVICNRAEKVDPLGAEIVSARALAPLSTLLWLTHRHLRPGGAALFLKGTKWQDEVLQAQKRWVFDHKVHQSQSHLDGAVLEIRGLQNA